MRSFFGLSPEYLQSIHQQFFYMKYYGGWSLYELYTLPVGLRNWYIQRLADHKEEENNKMTEANNKQTLRR